MKTFKTLVLASSLSVALFASVGAMAAEDDQNIGSTSTGKFDVTYSKENQAKIWGLDDVNLTASNHGENGGISESMTFCVYANATGTGSNLYDLSVTSTHGFKMVNAADVNEVAVTGTNYGLTFTDAKGNPKTQITTDTVLDGLDAGSLSSQPLPSAPCPTSGDNLTKVDVRFTGSASDVNAIPAGAYYDLITLVVSPK